MTDEFDKYADSYTDAVQESLPIRHVDVEVFVRLKAERLISLALRHFGRTSDRSVLDVGCGLGGTERYLVRRFQEAHGIDTSSALIDKASSTVPDAQFRHYGGVGFPFPADRFDLTFAICVLHHVQPQARVELISEMVRVTRPNGLVVLFEHNPWNPLTRRAVRNCDFDEDAVLLRRGAAAVLLDSCGLKVTEKRFITFLPTAGLIGKTIDSSLRWLPLGAQYYVAGAKQERRAP